MSGKHNYIIIASIDLRLHTIATVPNSLYCAEKSIVELV